MKKIRRAIGSIKNLSKWQNENDSNFSQVRHPSTSSGLGGVFYGNESGSPTHSYSNQEPSYVSYDAQSLDSYRTSIFSSQSLSFASTNQNISKLHQAAYSGDLSKVKKALKKIPVDTRDSNGRTALHMAAAAGHTGVILLLLGSMANLEIEDKDGKTPFLTAVEKNQVSATHLLLQSKVNGEASDNSDNMALHFAARSASRDLLELLLDQGLDYNSLNALGQSPLHIAASELNVEAVKVLVNYQANVNARDKEEVTPLMVVAKLGFAPLVDFLISAGADLDAVDRSQWNAAAYAKYNMYEELSEKISILSRKKKPSMMLFGFGGPAPKISEGSDEAASLKSHFSTDSWKDDSEESQEKPIITNTFLQNTFNCDESECSVEDHDSLINISNQSAISEQKKLSVSTSSLGPPKPPRLYTSTPNLVKEVEEPTSNAPKLRKTFSFKDNEKYHNHSKQSRPKESSLVMFASDNADTSTDENFDDPTDYFLLAGWGDDNASKNTSPKDDFKNNTNDSQEQISKKISLNATIPVGSNNPDYSGSNHGNLAYEIDHSNSHVESDKSQDLGIYVSSLPDPVKDPDSITSFVSYKDSNERKGSIGGTLGRRGTLHEIEELWESNAKFNENFEPDALTPSSHSTSRLSEIGLDKTTRTDVRKVFFGDSTENVFSELNNGNANLEKPQDSDIETDSTTTSLEMDLALQPHSLNGTSDQNGLKEDSNCLSKPNIFSSQLNSSNDDLLSLVRELRISLNRETAKQKSSAQKLSKLKEVEASLKQQLKDAESLVYHYKAEASSLGSKLAQVEFQAMGSLDDSKFALASLGEAQKALDNLEAEKDSLTAQVIEKEATVNQLEDENKIKSQMYSVLSGKVDTAMTRNLTHSSDQPENFKRKIISKEVQTIGNSELPSDVKETISDTLTQMEHILGDASTQIEKIIEKENVSLHVFDESDNELNSSTSKRENTSDIKPEKLQGSHETIQINSNDLYNGTFPLKETVYLNAVVQTDEPEIEKLPTKVLQAISTQTEETFELHSPFISEEESPFSKLDQDTIASLLKNIVKDSNDDIKNVFNSTMKEALKETSESLYFKQDYEGLGSNLKDLPELICTTLVNHINSIVSQNQFDSKSCSEKMNNQVHVLQEIVCASQQIKDQLSEESINIEKCVALNKANSFLLDTVKASLDAMPKSISIMMQGDSAADTSDIIKRLDDNDLLLQQIWTWVDNNKASFDSVFSHIDSSESKNARLQPSFGSQEEICVILKKAISNGLLPIKESIDTSDQTTREFLNQIKGNLEESQIKLNQSINSTIKYLLTNMDETVEENFQIVQNFLQNLHQNLIEKINEIRIDKVREVEEFSQQIKAISSDFGETKKLLSNLRTSVDVCQQFHSKPLIDETLVNAIHGNHDQALLSIQSQNKNLVNSFDKLDKKLIDIVVKSDLLPLVDLNKNYEDLHKTLKSLTLKNNSYFANLEKELTSLKDQNETITQTLKSLNQIVISEHNAEMALKAKLSHLEAQNSSLLEENAKLAYIVRGFQTNEQMRQQTVYFSDDKPTKIVNIDDNDPSELQLPKDPEISLSNSSQHILRTNKYASDHHSAKAESKLLAADLIIEDSIDHSIDCAIADANLVKREKKRLEKELKEKGRFIKELQNRIVDMESDQNEIERELSLKNSYLVLLKKEAYTSRGKIQEATDHMGDSTLSQTKNFKLEQHCRELEVDLSLKQSLIESLEKETSALAKDKLNLLHEISNLKENKLSSQILAKEKEMAEESAKCLEKELKEIYEKLSYEYVPKSRIENLYAQIESHFQILMSNKLKELNELLEEKFKSHTDKENQDALQNDVLKLQDEIKSLKSDFVLSDRKADVWHMQYDILSEKYERLLEEGRIASPQNLPSRNLASPKEKNVNMQDIIRDIDLYLNRPYPHSQFLTHLCNTTGSPSAWNTSSFASPSPNSDASFDNDVLDQAAKLLLGEIEIHSNSNTKFMPPNHSIMKAERDFDASFISSRDLSLKEGSNDSQVENSIGSYIDLLQSSFQ